MLGRALKATSDLERLQQHGIGAKVIENVAVTTQGNSRLVEEARSVSVPEYEIENEILKSGTVAQQSHPPQVISRKLKAYRAHGDEVHTMCRDQERTYKLL